LQAVAGKFDSAKNQREFDAFAKDHEKHEKEDAQPAAAPTRSAYASIFLLDILAKIPRNAIHQMIIETTKTAATRRSRPSKRLR